jgi:hypothetical protein
MNVAAGAEINVDFAEGGFGSAGIESIFLKGYSLTENSLSGIIKGHASWTKISYTFKMAGIEAGYWRSHDFYAPDGNFIFSSVSNYFNNLVITDRELITASLSLKFPYSDFFELYLGFDGYYDTDLNRFDNALTLHIKLDNLIRLASIKEVRK